MPRHDEWPHSATDLLVASFPAINALEPEEKSRPGATPDGFLMRLPARHCSGSAASIGNADAAWLTRSYRPALKWLILIRQVTGIDQIQFSCVETYSSSAVELRASRCPLGDTGKRLISFLPRAAPAIAGSSHPRGGKRRRISLPGLRSGA